MSDAVLVLNAGSSSIKFGITRAGRLQRLHQGSGWSLPRDAIQVTVRDGWVTLTAKVGWQFQKNRRRARCAKLSGVYGAINNVEIEPVAKAENVKKKI